jgi:hypothetical protein
MRLAYAQYDTDAVMVLCLDGRMRDTITPSAIETTEQHPGTDANRSPPSSQKKPEFAERHDDPAQAEELERQQDA